MPLKTRFVLLLGLLLAGFIGGLILLKRTQEKEVIHALEDSRNERGRLLDELLTLVAYPLEQFSRDYSQWDEMVSFAERPAATWAKINIDTSLTTFRLRAIWITRADGALAYRVGTEPETLAPDLPLTPTELQVLVRENKFPRFFAYLEGELCEIRGAPIQPSTDVNRTSTPQGWLFAASRWDRAQLETLGRLTGTNALLQAPDVAATPVSSGLDSTIIRPLANAQGKPLATLTLHYAPAMAVAADAFNQAELLIFVLQAVGGIALTILCLQIWILSPFRKITDSLRTGDPSYIKSILQRSDEAGRIARLVETYFADHAALARSERLLTYSLQERVRLGRDLHDNVIQTLFASGMTLAAARDMIRTDPAVAEKELAQIRSSLNEVIREVRTFIVGLEPESLYARTFSQAVSEMVTALRAIRPATFICDIDDAAAEKLPLDLRLHSLHALRESLLNSHRQANATHIHITCQPSTDGFLVRISDDGTPFSPGGTRTGDKALQTVTEGAQLAGARTDIHKSAQGGTQLQMIYPLPPKLRT